MQKSIKEANPILTQFYLFIQVNIVTDSEDAHNEAMRASSVFSDDDDDDYDSSDSDCKEANEGNGDKNEGDDDNAAGERRFHSSLTHH